MKIWNQILERLESNNNVYLLTVIESSGSAPGRRGFMMVVDDSGHMFGSIGGGIMEYNLVEKAKQFLQSGQLINICVKQIHRGDAHASSGMICSGEQTIAFTPLTVDQKETVVACIGAEMIQISHNGLKPIKSKGVETCQIQSETSWQYLQSQKVVTTIHIFGAGHVSVPTCELLNKLGYQVLLYDNRSGINTFEDNLCASSKQIIDYADVKANIKFNGGDFVLLMTHKFIEDKLILSQLLADLDILGYLGVLGSQNKIKTMFEALLKEGFKQTDLNKVFAPIGLDIHSKTTTEIAVSIVAEIIKVKNS